MHQTAEEDDRRTQVGSTGWTCHFLNCNNGQFFFLINSKIVSGHFIGLPTIIKFCGLSPTECGSHCKSWWCWRPSSGHENSWRSSCFLGLWILWCPGHSSWWQRSALFQGLLHPGFYRFHLRQCKVLVPGTLFWVTIILLSVVRKLFKLAPSCPSHLILTKDRAKYRGNKAESPHFDNLFHPKIFDR